MRVTKVHYNKHGGLDVFREEINASEGNWELFKFENCKQEPLPELEKAIENLLPIVMELEELPHTLKSKVTVRGLKIAYQKNEHAAVSLTAVRELEISGPSVINTPRRNITAESDEAIVLSTDHAILVSEVERLALDYVNGSRKELPEDEVKRTAFARGQEAFKKGLTHFDNEYKEEKDGTDAVDSWMNGFITAQKEAKGIKTSQSDLSELDEAYDSDEEEGGEDE